MKTLDIETDINLESVSRESSQPINQNYEIHKRTKCSQLFYELTTNSFANESIGFQSNIELIKKDKLSTIRGRWNNRTEFLLACIGSMVGFGNAWRFPIMVYENGGGSFLVTYTILCFIMGIPLVIMEFGIGQFSGRGPAKAFKLVPVLYGIGWSIILISVFIGIYYAAIISWCFYYFFASFKTPMPWTVCTHKFNTPNCLGSLDNKFNYNLSKFVSSTAEYWDYYVTGFIKYPGRLPYTMNEIPGTPMWHLTLCLLITWLLVGFAIMNGIKISGKVMYFTVVYPYIGLVILICLGATLPGAMDGIKFFLTPNWYKIYNPRVLYVAIVQLFFSSGIARGGLITYASFNDFRDNFYRDSFVVLFVDFATSLLFGFAIFPILGYMSQRTGVEIEKLITAESSLFFISFTEALATLPGSQLWTMLLMSMAITLGIDSQFALFETLTTGIFDVFPDLQLTNVFKATVIWIICFVYFLCGLLLITPGGKYWFVILDRRVVAYGLPLMLFLETVCVGHFYGYRNLREDFRMMTGFYLSWYWFIMIAFFCPAVVLAILIASLIKLERIKVYGSSIPLWGEIIGLFMLFILISPIIYGIIYTIFSFKKKYSKLFKKNFLKKLFDPPIYWGPFYKHEWMKNQFYRNKLIKNKDDPRFILYVTPYEDVHSIAEKTNIKVLF